MAKRYFSPIKQLMMFLEAVILLPFVFLCSLFCPYSKLYPFSVTIGHLLSRISSHKKEIVTKNLHIIFPNNRYSEQEIKDTTAIMAGYEFRIILEMIAFSRMNFQEMISYVRVQQHDQIARICHKQKNGSIGFTLHCGNWELLGSFVNAVGTPVAGLVERQFNPWMDRYVQHLRRKLGVKVVYNEISEMRPLIQHMKQGGVVALVADQSYWFDPLFIPFFHQEAAVPKGAAALALKMKSSLFCGYTSYLGEGIYGMEFDMDVVPNPSVLNVEDLMKTVYHKYETIIVKDPSNWYTLGSDRWDLTRESLAEWKKNPDSSRF